MFGFKRKPKQMTAEEYQAEYRRLLRELGNQFAIGESDYDEYLDALREHLLAESRFSPEQLAKIQWSLDEIVACGRELEQQGESGRSATEAVDYLILRVVDYCQLHPRQDGDA